MNPSKPEYLRISVTARCGLSCLYCRAPDRPCGDDSSELSVSALRLLAECAAAEGVRKLRLTGGEPLERDDLERIVSAVSSVAGIRETVLTTNGVALEARLGPLREAGLDRINASLDTLRPERFARITGVDAHAEVIRAVEKAAELFPLVKLNAVLLEGQNDDEVEDLVRFAAERGLRVRFVEYYGAISGAPGLKGVPSDRVLERIEAAFGRAVPMEGGALSVAKLYRLPEAGGALVGLIRSASTPPCRTCSKLRLTAAGELLPCLFARGGRSVREPLEEGRGGEVRAAMREVYASKRRSGPRGRRVSCVCEIGG